MDLFKATQAVASTASRITYRGVIKMIAGEPQVVTEAFGDDYIITPEHIIGFPTDGAPCLVLYDELERAWVLTSSNLPDLGKTFYCATSDASDIAGYKTLLTSPSAGEETSVATECTGTSDILVASFATDPGVPGAVDYSVGTAYRYFYAMVSGGTARLHFQTYKRDLAGTETLLLDEYSESFTNTDVAPQEWSATAPAAVGLLASDRLVAKLYVQRVAGPATITVTTFYEGTAHTSQIQTTMPIPHYG